MKGNRMRIGVGLPATLPGVTGSQVVEWARESDVGPFSSLGVLDRVLYDNIEPLTALAAAAAITQRISLATTIVIAPLRGSALLAKQAASVHALSRGRLVLGLGLGAREDDYHVTGSNHRTRGRRLTAQLVEMRDFWEREDAGPRNRDRPTLLVGGEGGLAMSRMARYSDGHVHGGGPPRAFARAAAQARAAWADMGRPGTPALWGMAYFQLAGDRDLGRQYLQEYYAFTGAFAEKIAAGLLTSKAEIDELTRGYAEEGCDELILFPTIPHIDQLRRLSDVVAGI